MVDTPVEIWFTQFMSAAATTTYDFLAEREAWVAAGRPADSDYARRCADVAAGADGPAIGIRQGDTYVVVEVA